MQHHPHIIDDENGVFQIKTVPCPYSIFLFIRVEIKTIHTRHFKFKQYVSSIFSVILHSVLNVCIQYNILHCHIPCRQYSIQQAYREQPGKKPTRELNRQVFLRHHRDNLVSNLSFLHIQYRHISSMDDVKRSRALLEEGDTGQESKRPPSGSMDAVVSDLVKDANECIFFRMVTDENHVAESDKEGGVYTPLMSHQLFGDEETINGYLNPSINVFLSPLFLPCIVVGYDKKILEEGATDLMKPMKQAFGTAHDNLDEFAMAIKEEGKVIDSPGELVMTRDLDSEGILEIWRSNLATASPFVKMIHARMEPLLLFYIDAASAIEADDPCWEILLCTIKSGGNVRIVGMSTIYAFYVYPDRKRFRLSQAFVLPHEQHKGIGSAIVDAVFDLAKRQGVVDVTLEDPTDDFRRLRDKNDLKEMIKLDWITSEAAEKLDSLGKGEKKSSDALPLSPEPETIEKLCKALMMNKKQAERMWESLLYLIAAESDSQDKLVAVEGFISKSIEDSFVTGAKDGSENKVVEDTPTGFIMYKTKSKIQMTPANMPPVEDVTTEQQRTMIADYVTIRVEEIKILVGHGNSGSQ